MTSRWYVLPIERLHIEAYVIHVEKSSGKRKRKPNKLSESQTIKIECRGGKEEIMGQAGGERGNKDACGHENRVEGWD